MKRFTLLLAALALCLSVVPSWAKGKNDDLPREITINGVELILIPEGWFYMAIPTPETNTHPTNLARNAKVWLDAFYIAKYEARARDFANFMNDIGKDIKVPFLAGQKACSVKPGEREGTYVLMYPEKDLPAANLSWLMALEFAEWMGFRIPSEAEWQKAARGTDKRLYPWGDEHPDETYAAFDAGISCNPSPVDHFPKGVSPYGVYNMSGNVREFVLDWHNKAYDDRIQDGTRNPPPPPYGTRYMGTRQQVIIKGGRWMIDYTGIRIPHRVLSPIEEAFRCNGVRFAADVELVRRHLAERKNAGGGAD